MNESLSEIEILDELRSLLGPRGGSAFQFDLKGETVSTNDDARAAGNSGKPEGFVVAADFQTAGRGRRDNSWASPPGRNLMFSMVLRPAADVDYWSRIPLLVGLAVARGIESALPDIGSIELKWPNDLMFLGKKLGGILVESRFSQTPGDSFCVAGVGLNVNIEPQEFPPEISDVAVSLFQQTGGVISRSKLLAHILAEWLTIYPAAVSQFEEAREKIDARSFLNGHLTEIRTPHHEISGIPREIGPRGELLVETESGIEEVHAAERVRRVTL